MMREVESRDCFAGLSRHLIISCSPVSPQYHWSLSINMTEHLEKEELEAFKQAFDAFDWNHNGKVSSAHLQASESYH